MIRTSIGLLVGMWACAAGPDAWAQGKQGLPGVDQPANLELDIPRAKRKAKADAPIKPSLSAEEKDRAARLAEGRRKFFQGQPDHPRSDPVPQFGGYDYKTDSGSFRPGATFKF